MCARAGILASGWLEAPPASPPAKIVSLPLPAGPTAHVERERMAQQQRLSPMRGTFAVTGRVRWIPAAGRAEAPFSEKAVLLEEGPEPSAPNLSFPVMSPVAAVIPISPPALLQPSPGGKRWSASGWLFARKGGASGFVPGGTLGGSQAGMRLTYRLNGDATRPLALTARLYTPLDNVAGAEAAAGVDWKPVARLPVHLLAERRQALSNEGRSAFSLTAYGGVSERKVGPLRLDAYAQAGIIGMKSRDLFADGSARLSLPLQRAKIGGGFWGAAQPGVERLDVGPQASYRLPVRGANVVVAADWRFRLAGDASPASGPTLTLATDF